MATRVSLKIAPQSAPVHRSLPTAPPPPAITLSTADAPPLILPGEHFAAAVIFLLSGLAGLAWIAPDLSLGVYTLPRVVAVVHLFTLGFISMSILGALYQFLPVAVGEAIRSQRLAHVTFAIYLLGIPTLVVGLLLFPAQPLLVSAGAGLVATAFTLFAANLGLTLLAAKSRDLTFWALSGAAFYLVVTLVFGFLLAFNLTNQIFLGETRFGLLVAHVHVALVGWVMLVMVGVGNRLLPMFMLSHGHKETFMRVALGCLVVGCALVALPLGLTGPIVRYTGFGVIACGVLSFLLQAIEFYRHRKKGKLDPGMRIAVLGLYGVGAALVLGPIAFFTGGSVVLLTTYVFVLVVGGISVFITGYYFKIIPFIVWNQRFRDLVGRSKHRVPSVSELYSAKVATTVLFLELAGVLTTALAILLQRPMLVYAGVGSLFVGVLLLAQQLIRVARTKVPA